jgi:hypothetical protein
MLTVPSELANLIVAFAPLFSKRVWTHAQALIVGAILSPTRRTVTQALRVMGTSDEAHFQNYHRVLNRAVWSSLEASRILLNLLLIAFAPTGPLVFGLDDTIERRRGAQIKATGICRDPVRASHSHFVKASGLRWLCYMWLVEMAWADRVWGLPFLTALCPSERFHQEQGRAHKKLTDWAWQIIHLLHRWLPRRELIFVADSSFAVITLLKSVSQLPQTSVLTRLRLDAALDDPAPPRVPGQNGRPRLTGARRPTLKAMLDDPATRWRKLKAENWYDGEEREVEVCTAEAVWYHSGMPPVMIRWVLIRDPQTELEPQALLSTDLKHTPQQSLEWFVRRWAMEVSFEESRRHLGIETQRQWNELAIARTTPALFGLYSLVTLVAKAMMKNEARLPRTAAWYATQRLTFSDALAMVRRCLWSECHFSTSAAKAEMIKVPRALLERLTDAVCYAA